MAKKVNLDVAQTLNITCRRGDTFKLDLTLKDAAGDPLDLADSASTPPVPYKFSMQVRDSEFNDGDVGLLASTVEGVPNGADYLATIEPINGTSTGGIEIIIKDVDMKKVPSGRYVYDLQYIIPEAGTGPNGAYDVTTTILKGAFIVNEDVTEYFPDENARAETDRYVKSIKG